MTNTKAKGRMNAALKILGWQGGTIHQVAKEFGIDSTELLYSEAEDTLLAAYGQEVSKICPVYSNFNIFTYPFTRYKAEKHKGEKDFWLTLLDCFWLSMVYTGKPVEELLRMPQVKKTGDNQTCDHCKKLIYNFQEILETEKVDGTKVYRHAGTHLGCFKYRKLKAEVVKRFHGGSVFPEPYTVTLPADLRCVEIDGGDTHGFFYLDEFPSSIFPSDSFIRHDATHYGILILPNEVY